MGLDEYIKKRDFKNTPEPGADYSNENRGRFVIQRHAASSLHYDLRLEMDGVLKSWAVPKGPSMNPGDKRLAVQTEDHPVKYLDFEGTIPKGNYGAGKMQIWDKGVFKSDEKVKDDLLAQLENGNLKIKFTGQKIRGEFVLVKTKYKAKQDQWLLIKKKDDYATDLDYDAEVFVHKKKSENEKEKEKIRKIELSKVVKPMLATATDKIFNNPDWIYEIKWDGYRCIAQIEDRKVNLYSRNGRSFNKRFPEVKKVLQDIPHEVVIDGEIVVLDQDNKPNFQALQNYSETTSGELRFYVFDLLYLNGHSTVNLPLVERKSLLPDILEDLKKVFYCDHIEGMGTAFYNKAIDAGLEGVIAKKSDSTYTPGYRSENWMKIKANKNREAIVCGYTASEGSIFGSLILGAFENGKLQYIGNCGTGFSIKEQKDLLKKFNQFKRKTSPFSERINLKGKKPIWLTPKLICEVKYSEITKNGYLRHPVFRSIREDKEPKEITSEKRVSAPRKNTKSKQKGASLEVDGYSVDFTSLDKIYWPDSGYRKYDLIDYYIKVSDLMLPYLKDRPQNLHRYPNGITKKGFYQKDTEGQMPDWIERVEIHSDSAEKNIEYMLCQHEATLLYMANLGCIEINPWNSRENNLDYPDYTVIDLDPSDNNSFDEVIEVAQATKKVMDSVGVEGFCKTSGSSGLHIYIPLGAKYTYDEAVGFTKLLCYFIQEKVPKITSMERAKKARKNKIYLDYLQNRKGQTLAAAYCVRPKPKATVSTPLEWKEVKKGLKTEDFTIESIPDRIEKIEDPFKGILGKGIDMEKALEQLENK